MKINDTFASFPDNPTISSLREYHEKQLDIFKGWFSNNGGTTFGFSRLGYFVADWMFQDFAKEIGEINTLLLWKENEFFQIVEGWLKQNMEKI